MDTCFQHTIDLGRRTHTLSFNRLLTFFLNDVTSTPASAATASSRFLLVSNTLRLRSRSRVRRHTCSCLGSRSAAKSLAHSGQRAMPLAGGPLSADSCCFRDCGRGEPVVGVVRLTTGGRGAALAGSGETRLAAAGFCGSLAALTKGFWIPAVVDAVTLATAAAAPAPAANALITVGCTTGGSSNLFESLNVAIGFLGTRPTPPPPPPPPPTLPLTVASGFFTTVAVLLFIRAAGRCSCCCGQTNTNYYTSLPSSAIHYRYV